ncbi:hemolysin [Clostridium sp. YIM B02500]|nr:hemolysin [Clostridium sp. YIM B02500]
MKHVKFNSWEIKDEDDANKSGNEERVYIDEIPFL